MRFFLLLFTCGLGIALPAFSQTNGNYSYTIAVKGFSIIQQPKIFQQDNQKYLNAYVNGGMFKFNDNQFSYRVGGSVLNKDITYTRDCVNCELADGKITNYAFKIGFEKNFNYARIQPYFAFDVGYRFNRFKGVINNVNNLARINSVSSLEDTKDGGTATPTIGIKINPIEHISFFVESSLEFYYAYVREEITSQDAIPSSQMIKFNRGEFLLNPISVGIQIHLGNKN